MTPHEVAASYDQIAQRWISPEFAARNGLAQHELALSFLPAPSGWALDAGCGANGRIIALVRARGLQAEGVDLSPVMLELARRQHPDVTFYHADLCEWVPPRRYSFISGWDSLWHLPLDRQESVLARLASALVPGGVMIFSTGGIETPDEHVNHFMGVPMYHAAPGIPRLLAAVPTWGCRLRHFAYDQFPENHVCVIVQRDG